MVTRAYGRLCKMVVLIALKVMQEVVGKDDRGIS